MRIERLSLSARVLLIVMLALLLGGIVMGGVLFHFVTREAFRVFDSQLAQQAEVLLGMAKAYDGLAPRITVDDDGDADEHSIERVLPEGEHAHYRQRAIHQIFATDVVPPRLLARSAGAPDTPLPAGVSGGFVLADWGGTQWRFYHLRLNGREVIVGQDAQLRRLLAHEFVEHALPPMLLGMLGVLVTVWLGVLWGLRPLKRLAQQLGNRGPQQLDPLELPSLPGELALLVDALNALLRRLERALENERRFTADAAHELRTPLAALAAQIQNVSHAPDEAHRTARLATAEAGIQRMTRLVEQLLATARLDSLDSARREACDLSQIARDLCAEMAPAALAREVDMALDAPDSLPLHAQPDLLRALLRNLVDNALRFAPAGSELSLALVREGDRVLIRVQDAGPGVSPELLPRLGQRFARDPGSGVGAGLGLSIARRIAELHGGSLQVTSIAPHGCCVEAQIAATTHASSLD